MKHTNKPGDHTNFIQMTVWYADFPRIIQFHKINASNKNKKCCIKISKIKHSKMALLFTNGINDLKYLLELTGSQTDKLILEYLLSTNFLWTSRSTDPWPGQAGPWNWDFSKLSWFIVFKPFWTFVAFFSKEPDFVRDFSIDQICRTDKFFRDSS